MPPKKIDFQNALRHMLETGQDGRTPYVDVRSGDLHRIVGYYPSRNNRMPLCCKVMRESMRDGDQILEQPPREDGVNLIIRYRLPRPVIYGGLIAFGSAIDTVNLSWCRQLPRDAR